MSNLGHISNRLAGKQKAVTFVTHLICILILFFLPEVIMSISSPRHEGVQWGIYVKSLVYVAVFYVNYYLIIDRSLGKEHGRMRFVLYNLLLIIATLAILYLSWHYFESANANLQPAPSLRPAPIPQMQPPLHPGPHPAMLPGPQPAPVPAPRPWQTFPQNWTFLIRDLVVVVLTIALSYALKINDKWTKLEQRQKALAASQKEEELKNLKNQLNPHFLFNTLNTIYALIEVSPPKAQNAVHELSQLLRYVLYENARTVTLGQELAFIDNYIYLMRLRLNGSRPVEINLDAGDSADFPVAPLMFISLIENCFKHGNRASLEDPIRISITAKKGIVTCRTFNHYDPQENANGKHSGGIGLTNLRRRLDLLYPDNSSLETLEENCTFTVTLMIDLNQTA